MELSEVVRSGLLGGIQGTCSETGGRMPLQEVDRPHRLRENDEGNQREESSSTESTHQEVVDTFTLNMPVFRRREESVLVVGFYDTDVFFI